jgi:hypothetical protein
LEVTVPAGVDSSVEIFCSYSHKDETLREKFDPIVKNLQRHNEVQVWHDRKIAAGSEWADEIDKHLNSADIVVLLVSSDFLASDYCYEKEMGRALEREAKSEVVIVPVLVRPCDWQDAPFGRLQVIPKGEKAITAWKNRDEAWTQVSLALKSTIRSVLSKKAERLKQQIKHENPGVDLLGALRRQGDFEGSEAKAIYAKILSDAQLPEARIESLSTQFRVLLEMQAKVDRITGEIGPVRTAAKKRAEDAFRQMDEYINGE